MVSHGTGGAFLPQPKARNRINKNRMTVLVFIVSTIGLSLDLEVLLAERFALNLVWSQGFA
jgi:ABC-type nitrate/sulfonate/bicarbonate transport system permease component